MFLPFAFRARVSTRVWMNVQNRRDTLSPIWFNSCAHKYIHFKAQLHRLQHLHPRTTTSATISTKAHRQLWVCDVLTLCRANTRAYYLRIRWTKRPVSFRFLIFFLFIFVCDAWSSAMQTNTSVRATMAPQPPDIAHFEFVFSLEYRFSAHIAELIIKHHLSIVSQCLSLSCVVVVLVVWLCNLRMINVGDADE